MSMSKSKKSFEIDMTNGPIFSKILVFSLPLIASGMLQLLFNAADVIVVGQFAGSQALAAVGSTGSLTNLIINIFMGLSVGANVVVANFYGGHKDREVSDAVHTSILISLLAGVVLVGVGIALSRPMLSLMGTPEDVIDYSVLYMRIYFAGMPVMMIYNFGSAILRAVGDTRRPLFYLAGSGVVNVGLNLIFVIIFDMGVAGVAIATVVSQVIAAVLVVRCLMKAEGPIRLDLRKLRINKSVLAKICAIGFPAGIQGVVFNISNVLIQSSVNSFGSVAMAGNTAGSNIEGFVYVAMNAMGQTAVSFVGQNAGARNFKRIKKIILECELFVAGVGIVLGNLAVLGGRPLLRLYTEDPQVIEYGMVRLTFICTLYCLCGMMDTFVGAIRGLGRSVVTTVISLIGACAIRIIYIFTYFRSHHELGVLYASYPITWFITALAQFIYLVIVFRQTVRMFNSQSRE